MSPYHHILLSAPSSFSNRRRHFRHADTTCIVLYYFEKQLEIPPESRPPIGESSLDLPYGGEHLLSMLSKARTGTRARASPKVGVFLV
jgi:hypothetical protein